MKRTLICAAVSCLIGAGVVLASDSSATLSNNWKTKGYVAIGGSVIVLPERLQSGDRIDFFGSNGEQAMEQSVGRGYIEMNFSQIPTGVYNMVITRKGEKVTEHQVPIAGGL